MKTCSRCKETKPFESFSLCKANKDGYQGWCQPCVNEARRKPIESPEIIEQRKSEQRRIKLEKKRLYYLPNKERHAANMAANYLKNKEEAKKRIADWKKQNAAKVNANCMKRHAQKLNATPSWLTEEDHWLIEETYDLARLRTQMFGFVWHVDHIVPLKGENVCGLHVPYNLQVILASANCSKRNRFES
jgi:hypothetical protein